MESLAELRFAKGVRRGDLPMPSWNRIVEVDGVARRVDALWVEAGLGVEIKGRTYHGDDVWAANLLRDAGVVAEGITILPLPARAVLTDLDMVLALVGRAVEVRWPVGVPFVRTPGT